MRLLDQIVQSVLPVEVADASGAYRIEGAGSYAAAVRGAPIRFVLDRAAADFCRTLIETDRGMMVSENAYLRFPFAAFWIEWAAPPCGGEGEGTRVGLLVEGSADGRAAEIVVFWEQERGEPVVAQVVASADLDQPWPGERFEEWTFLISPGQHPLARHLVFRCHPAWRPFFGAQTPADVSGSMAIIINNVLPGLEMLFAFSALLAERAGLREKSVDMSRLNRSRQRHKRPALLDHVEVRLDLSPVRDGNGVRATSSGARGPARLHSVRGHLVSRNGRSFWRRSHLRGDPSRVPVTRTVTVVRSGG